MIDLFICIVTAIGGLIVLPFACVMLWSLMIAYVLLKSSVRLARWIFRLPRRTLEGVQHAGF